jgi:hypothetical protein
LSNGAWLIPDVDYPQKQPALLTSESLFVAARLSVRHFFIIRDDYLKVPLEMRRIEKGGRTVYYISQREGGPTVDFLGGWIFTRGPERFIRPGSLSHYPTFFDTHERRFQKMPKEIVSFFSQLATHLKKSYRRIKPKKVTFWVSSNALSEVERGAKLVGLEDLSVEEILPTRRR